MPSKQQISAFQRKIFSYYKKNKRDLPWRKTTDPYPILISEIMLQQTQVDRVIGYYNRWLQKWPTVHDLANASRVDVLKEWLGLGYNNRAKNLHETAKLISQKYQGDVLKATPHYKELPGIGPYTSNAVQIFSSNKDVAAIDTNIRRILIHEFSVSGTSSDKELQELAEHCLPKGKSRDWHNALMDYGATLLTSRKSGIKPKTTQSTFEGSDRQIRARILRLFLKTPKKIWSIEGLKKALDILDINRDKEKIKQILEALKGDGLIQHAHKKYALLNA